MPALESSAASRMRSASTAARPHPTGPCSASRLDAPVDRPTIRETTALGEAYLAGLSAGVYPEPAKFADNWRLQHRFKPAMSAATRERKLAGWARAVKGGAGD